MARGKTPAPLNIWNLWLREGNPTENPGPPSWGLGMGPTPPTHKNILITETRNRC